MYCHPLKRIYSLFPLWMSIWCDFDQWYVNRSTWSSWEVFFSIAPEWNISAMAGAKHPPWTSRTTITTWEKPTMNWKGADTWWFCRNTVSVLECLPLDFLYVQENYILFKPPSICFSSLYSVKLNSNVDCYRLPNVGICWLTVGKRRWSDLTVEGRAGRHLALNWWLFMSILAICRLLGPTFCGSTCEHSSQELGAFLCVSGVGLGQGAPPASWGGQYRPGRGISED